MPIRKSPRESVGTDVIYTRFRNERGLLTKQVCWQDGVFHKISATQLSKGCFETGSIRYRGDATETLTAFGQALGELTESEAIGTGRHVDPTITSGPIVTKNLTGPGLYARTKEFFVNDPGLALLLFDGDDNLNLFDDLVALCQMFASTAFLVRPSSSAGILHTASGQEMKGGGMHGYILIDRGDQAKAVLEGVMRLAWRQGKGRIRVGASGSHLVRGPIDASVYPGSRLIYEAPVVLDGDLTQRPREFTVHPGGVLDVARFLAFVDREAPKAVVDDLIRREKQSPQVRHESETKRAGWVEARTQALARNGMSNAEAKKAAKLGAKAVANGVKGILTGSLTFETDDGRVIPIADILLDPEAHAGLTGPDPQEGRAHGGGKAIVLLGDDGRPFIFSFAHGEGVYRLVHDRASLERGLRTGNFRSHADFIAAMVDGIALNRPHEDFLHHLSADEVFPDVLYRASVSALKQAREEAEAERREAHSEQFDDRIPLFYEPAEPAAMAELLEHGFAGLSPPVLYEFGGRWAAVTGEPVALRPDPHRIVEAAGRNRLSILRVSHAQATYYVSTHFIIIGIDRRGIARPIAPPASVIRVALDLPPDRRTLQHLEAIRSIPPIADTGEIRTTPGVHEGIFYDGSAGRIVVPENPTLADAPQAWKYILDTVFCEFPFRDDLDKANLLALLVTLATRHELGTAPAFVIGARLPGTGKSLLAEIAILIATGARAPNVGFDNEDVAEIRKVLTTYIASGAQAILFDNTEGEIGNAQLNRALTAEIWGDRILSTNTAFEGRNNATFIFTANGAVVKGDARRRFLRIQLEVRDCEHPESRPIKNRRLAATVMEKRPEIVSALLTIIKAHRINRMPGECFLGSFDQWAQRVGRLVQWVTGLDPTSVQSTLAEDDPDQLARHMIVQRLEEWFGDSEVSTSEIYTAWRCDPMDPANDRIYSPDLLDLHDAIRRLSRSERMSKITFGRMLSDLTDRQVGDRTLRKRVCHKSKHVFQLVAAAGAMPIAKRPAKTPEDTFREERLKGFKY